MNPFYFGSAQRRLFGLYTPARAGSARMRAVVLCHPWGQEYLRAHRAMRHVARLLSEAGFHVLQFDYFGTGDSAGEMTDADLIGWSHDIDMAVDELKDTTGVTRVTLIGLRLGATLAASVAVKRRNDMDALVLWDPIVSGIDYLAELHSDNFAKTGAPARARAAATGGGHEILGFPLTAAMEEEIRPMNLLSVLPALAVRTLVIVSALPVSSELASTMALHPTGPLTLEQIGSQSVWIEDRVIALPVKILQRIVDWLA